MSLPTLPSLTLKNVLERSVKIFSDKIALAEVDGSFYTFASLGAKVVELSSFLQDQGIMPGDRVAILSENKPNWGVAYFAITTMGAVAVPILIDFHSADVKHIIRHSGAKAIFVSQRLYNKIEDEFESSLQLVILIDDFSIIPLQTKKDRLQEIIAEGSKELIKIKRAALRLLGREPVEIREQDLAAIIYTSGTTGHSKGVMLSHKNIVYDALATMQIIDVDDNDRLLSILPLPHAYECTLGLVLPIMIGAAVYYLDKPPTAKVLLPALEKVKPTIILSVPLIIEKIFKTRVLPHFTKNKIMRTLYKMDFVRKQLHKKAGKKLLQIFGGQLKSFCIGGASLSPEVELFLREAGFPYAIGYGLTETSPLVAGTDPAGTVFRSTGKALPGIEIKIDSSDPEQIEGEILVRGPVVMQGYYRDAARTAEVLTKDGWLHTGDLGFIDDNGYLFIKGRLKNVIIGPSGENIYPEEIETIFNQHEKVLESLVYEQNGQLLARVYLNYEELDEEFRSKGLDDSQAKEQIARLLEDIRLQVNSRVAPFSRINKIIEQQEPFEKTPTQKIKRYLYV